MPIVVRAVIACLLWAAWLSCAWAQEVDSALPGWLVTSAALESKIAEAEAATERTEEAKTRLIELYRKALSNQQAAKDNAASAATFRRTAEGAPAEIQAIRAALAPDVLREPMAGTAPTADIPLPDLEQRLREEQADLTAADARRADLESKLAALEQRPEAISLRLAEATQQREEASALIQTAVADDASPTFAQAQKWVLETRYMALSTETTRLEQELSTLPLRAQLLEAKYDREKANVDSIGERIRALEGLIDRKRRQAAEQATTAAEQTRRELEGMHPVLVELSAENAALSRDVNDITQQLQAQDRVRRNLERIVEQLSADFQDARETLESGEINDDLGRFLLQQFDALPDLRPFVQNDTQRKTEIAELTVRGLKHRAEARRIADADATVEGLALELQADAQTEARKAKLLELVQQRQTLLAKALDVNSVYLGKLRELDRAEQALLATAAEYDAYLDEQLPWLRNAKPMQLKDIRALPSELGARLAAADLPGLPRLIGQQLARSPAFWLAVIGAGVLVLRRRAIIAAIESVAPRIGKPTTDRMNYTGWVLGLTLLLAAPLPLLLAVAGWHLQVDAGGTELSRALGNALKRAALHLSIFFSLGAICLPHGLAAVHFRWPERNLTLLRTQIRLLVWPFVVAVLIVNVAIGIDRAETGGTLAKLALVLGYLPLSWFLYQVFHPRHGMLAHLRAGGDYPTLFRTYIIWYPLIVGAPLALIALAWSGYVYTATTFSYLFLLTLWFLFALVLGNSLALRWLQVTRRRLAYEAAMKRRRAAQELAEEQEALGEMGELPFEEAVVNITALSDDTRGLIRILVLTSAIAGFYLIWSSALPALHIFDDVILWHGTEIVDGAEQPLPITLGNLGQALLYAIGAWVLANRLPALLEILLLQRFHMTAAGRYTLTTLTTYVVVAVGLLLVLSTLGARWSQVQWLAAALSVGIGFGLQEIVANFISGLIILFERPIRVGDAVTVGDTDGVVTKIKIRATTIRNFDGKELLVPNKEFITGRLLNWSLSDQTTRIVLAIGIAYGSPVRQAMDLLKEAADENPNVLDEPSPTVIFETFGDNALGLLLRCFVDSIDLRVSTISALNEAINDKFNAAGISIAFPQRDVHLDTIKPLRVQIEQSGAANE